MTIEEYKKKSFKTDGNGNDVLIADVWNDLSREQRRYITTKLKKGKIPNFVDIIQ